MSSRGSPRASLALLLGDLAPVVALAFGLGLAFRLAFPGQITYLGDEDWTFRHVEGALSGRALEMVGMPSSRGVRNAGMSVWVFVALGALGQVTTPPGLVRVVALGAYAGHLGVLSAALGTLRRSEERRAFIWAFVLSAVNPVLVFVERKIWAQSVLPLFCALLLWGFLRRDTRAGAFVWGLVGALVGQIHMAGFFFVPALAAFTRFASAGLETPKPPRWAAWLAGSLTGGLPAVPWLLYLVRERPQASSSGSALLRFRLEFYQYFFSDPTGLAGEYVVGRDLRFALAEPRLFGHATWLVAIAHIALAVASIAIAIRALRHLAARRHDLWALLLRPRSETGLLLAATLVGMGGLMTLPSIAIHRHYMLVAYPLPFVWAARVAMRAPGGERWLRVLFVGCAVVTIGLFSFVVREGGADEMGKTWAAQMKDGTTPAEAKAFRKDLSRSVPSR